MWLALQRQFYATFVSASLHCRWGDECYFYFLKQQLTETCAAPHYQTRFFPTPNNCWSEKLNIVIDARLIFITSHLCACVNRDATLNDKACITPVCCFIFKSKHSMNWGYL